MPLCDAEPQDILLLLLGGMATGFPIVWFPISCMPNNMHASSYMVTEYLPWNNAHPIPLPPSLAYNRSYCGTGVQHIRPKTKNIVYIDEYVWFFQSASMHIICSRFLGGLFLGWQANKNCQCAVSTKIYFHMLIGCSSISHGKGCTMVCLIHQVHPCRRKECHHMPLNQLLIIIPLMWRPRRVDSLLSVVDVCSLR